jgi:Tfp pilus assembly protein PilV
LSISSTFFLIYTHNQQWSWEKLLERMHHVSTETLTSNNQQWNKQTELISPVLLISTEQVWISLSEAQQQTVAAALARICRGVARHLQKPSEEEDGHERNS